MRKSQLYVMREALDIEVGRKWFMNHLYLKSPSNTLPKAGPTCYAPCCIGTSLAVFADRLPCPSGPTLHTCPQLR